MVDLAGLVKGAAFNMSQGCSRAASGAHCSSTEAFGVDVTALGKPSSGKQSCSLQLVLLPHHDVRETSSWPKPFAGAALFVCWMSSTEEARCLRKLECSAVQLPAQRVMQLLHLFGGDKWGMQPAGAAATP